MNVSSEAATARRARKNIGRRISRASSPLLTPRSQSALLAASAAFSHQLMVGSTSGIISASVRCRGSCVAPPPPHTSPMVGVLFLKPIIVIWATMNAIDDLAMLVSARRLRMMVIPGQGRILATCAKCVTT